MLREPLVRNPTRKRVSKVTAIGAPTGGLNRRDAVTDMQPTDAIVLENVIPTSDGCRLRKGYSSYATGIGGNYVETLLVYSAQDGTEQMFAADPTDIYDVSSTGAVGAADVSSLNNGRWSYVNFSTTGGHYLIAANGADDVRSYDGSSWATPTLTGVTSADIIYVASHMNRIWLIEKNALSVWYLPVGAITGTVTEFPLGTLSRLGGQLLAMGSWTRDGGAGLDDVAVFITSEGEAIIYSGTDPDDAATWQLVGIFRIPQPIGRRCLVKVGADLGVLTTQGLLPLSAILPLSGSAQGKSAATNKISGLYANAWRAQGNLFGWQVIEHPLDKLIIVNVPVSERITQIQHVMNSETGSWCTFDGLNAGCWALYGNELYFGGNDGAVYKYTGDDDDGAVINGRICHAYQAYGTPHRKVFDRVRPILFGPSNYIPGVAMTTDFEEAANGLAAQPIPTSGPIWDMTAWDTEYWGDEGVPSIQWQAVSGDGIVGAVNVALSSDEPLVYNGCLVAYRTGGPL